MGISRGSSITDRRILPDRTAHTPSPSHPPTASSSLPSTPRPLLSLPTTPRSNLPPPPPTLDPVRAGRHSLPSPTPSPVAAPFQPSRVSAPAPFQPARVSAPAPAPPNPAAIAKELEQKLFVTETALAPPAAPAAAAVAAAQVDQPEEEKAPEVDLAPVSKKGLAHPARPGTGTVGKKVMIRANHFLVNVADNNLFHYDEKASYFTKDEKLKAEYTKKIDAYTN